MEIFLIRKHGQVRAILEGWKIFVCGFRPSSFIHHASPSTIANIQIQIAFAPFTVVKLNLLFTRTFNTRSFFSVKLHAMFPFLIKLF